MRELLVYLKNLFFLSAAVIALAILLLFLHYSFLVFLKFTILTVIKLSRAELILFTLSIYFLAILCGFFLLNFTGLYGTMCLCTVPAAAFWVSLCYNINFFVLKGGYCHLTPFKWFKLTSLLEVKFELFIDLVSFSFLFLTATIALFVTFFTFSYFRYEPNVEKLLLLLNAFVLSMLLLVVSGNLVVLFFSWEMIGLTSFLLINFWLTRVGTVKAAFKAYTLNKLSDLSFFFAVLLVYYSFTELSFSRLNYLFFLYNDYVVATMFNLRIVELISFFFLTAAFIKSAQVGFHIWLPDSMEAPVPASALIHSATLVSAGIFLTLRLQPLLELSLFYHTVVPVVGAFTAFFGGFSAFFQTDLKRILAYSTISHCGFLFFLTCFNCVEFTLIYLYIHGFFKASAFLCVGNIIRFSKNFQDIRRMGFYWKFLPFELYMLAFCLLNLSGLPFFFGFLIKHFLFFSFDYFFQSFLSFGFIFLASFSGIFYSFRIYYFIFFDSKKARGSVYYNYTNESTFSDKYGNSSLGGNASIFFLVYSAVLISLIFIFWLYVLRAGVTCEVGFYLGKTGAMHAYKMDLGLLFNFKILNTVISIFFLFLNFFKWNQTFTFSFTSFFSVIIAMLLLY